MWLPTSTRSTELTAHIRTHSHTCTRFRCNERKDYSWKLLRAPFPSLVIQLHQIGMIAVVTIHKTWRVLWSIFQKCFLCCGVQDWSSWMKQKTEFAGDKIWISVNWKFQWNSTKMCLHQDECTNDWACIKYNHSLPQNTTVTNANLDELIWHFLQTVQESLYHVA